MREDPYDKVKRLLNDKRYYDAVNQLVEMEQSYIKALSLFEQVSPELPEKFKDAPISKLIENTRDMIESIEKSVFKCNTSWCASCRKGVCHDSEERKGLSKCVNHS